MAKASLQCRVRSRGSVTNPDATASQTLCNGTVTNYAGMKQGYLVGVLETMTDWVEPNYRERKAKGEIMNHPIHHVKQVYAGDTTSTYAIVYTPTCSGTTIKRMDGTGHQRNLITGFAAPPWSQQYQQEERDRLKITVGNATRAGIVSPDVQGLVFAAEFAKTLGMIKHPLRSLRGVLEGLAKTQRFQRYKLKRKAAGHAGATLFDFVSENWLIFRFGIMPTIYDIEGFTNFLRNPVKMSPRLTSRSKQTISSGTVESSTPYTETYFGGSVTRTSSVEITVKGGCLYEHEGSVVNRLGLELQAIPEAMWELVPFSFIVDRVVNIGDFIAASVPKTGVKVLAEWTSFETVTRDAVGWLATPKTVANTATTGVLAGSATRVYTDKVRLPTLGYGLTYSNIFHKNRGMKESTMIKQIVDEIFLFKQVVHKIRS